ncbi:MAG: hypothetical protein IT280_06170 [Ignavibacteria bacterium]|nr:hypothetical protein [Ignavibacteria bacterium]
MSQSAGNISINLTLNLEPFKQGLQEALHLLQNLQTAKIANPDASGYVQLKNAIEKTIPQVDKLEKEIKEETLAQKVAVEWKERSGWRVDEPEHTDPELIINYAKFRRYCEEKKPAGLNGTIEELIISLCEDYNLKPNEAEELKQSSVLIYSMIKEKEGFETWWGFNNKD